MSQWMKCTNTNKHILLMKFRNIYHTYKIYNYIYFSAQCTSHYPCCAIHKQCKSIVKHIFHDCFNIHVSSQNRWWFNNKCTHFDTSLILTLFFCNIPFILEMFTQIWNTFFEPKRWLYPTVFVVFVEFLFQLLLLFLQSCNDFLIWIITDSIHAWMVLHLGLH